MVKTMMTPILISTFLYYSKQEQRTIAAIAKAKELKNIHKIYNVDKEVLETLLDVESNNNMLAKRFEPSQVKKAKKLAKVYPDADPKDLASSHCSAQILASTAHTLGVDPRTLSDELTCKETALMYFNKMKTLCYQIGVRGKENLIKCAAEKYNGSGEKAKNYATKFMAKLYKKNPNLFNKHNVYAKTIKDKGNG